MTPAMLKEARELRERVLTKELLFPACGLLVELLNALENESVLSHSLMNQGIALTLGLCPICNGNVVTAWDQSVVGTKNEHLGHEEGCKYLSNHTKCFGILDDE